MTSLQAQDQQYIANTYARFPLTLSHGKGAVIFDTEGKRYLDLGSGIAVNSFGIADEEWQRAVTAQLQKLPHTSNLYYTEPQVKLAKLMCEKTGMKKVFFSNSGAEANECAIKAARKYSRDRYGEGRFQILTLQNSFHGRTMATLTATGQEKFHQDFAPMLAGFLYTPANDIPALQAVVAEHPDLCAIMFECIQGEGGVCPLEPDFVQAMVTLAKEKDLLLIVDEVQTGNGRTGKLFGYMHYGFTPDIVTTAKGLGGGLPIGATLFAEKTQNVLTPGTHGSTFGGNPVCAAGALSIFERLDEKILSDIAKKGQIIFDTLSASPAVEQVSGMGLMWGITTKKPAVDIVNACMDQGVLVLTAKDKVRLLPPYTITVEELKEALDILIQIIEA